MKDINGIEISRGMRVELRNGAGTCYLRGRVTDIRRSELGISPGWDAGDIGQRGVYSSDKFIVVDQRCKHPATGVAYQPDPRMVCVVCGTSLPRMPITA